MIDSSPCPPTADVWTPSMIHHCKTEGQRIWAVSLVTLGLNSGTPKKNLLEWCKCPSRDSEVTMFILFQASHLVGGD